MSVAFHTSPRTYSQWVLRLLDVQFEPVSPLTGEVFDLFIDAVAARVLDDVSRRPSERVLGIPTWRERREASRTLYASALSGRVPGIPVAHKTAAELRECAMGLEKISGSCAAYAGTLHQCAEAIDRYNCSFMRAQRRSATTDPLCHARRITRIERDLVSTLLGLVHELEP